MLLPTPGMVFKVTLASMDWLLEKGYARGLDGVDVSMVMPAVNPDWVPMFVALNQALAVKGYAINPNNAAVEQAQLTTHTEYASRSLPRVFYSLLSARQSTRGHMAPNATPLEEAIPALKTLQTAGVSVLIHQIFVEGLNDSDTEVEAVIAFMNNHFSDSELRVLRYNHCDRSPYHEWTRIDEALKRLAQGVPCLKVQESAGSEVQAACGQFLVARPRRIAG